MSTPALTEGPQGLDYTEIKTGADPEKAHPRMRRMMEHFDKLRGCGNQDEVGKYYEDWARMMKDRAPHLGFEFRKDAVGNCAIRIKGKDPRGAKKIIQTHRDHVPNGGNENAPTYAVYGEDGWIRSKNRATTLTADPKLMAGIFMTAVEDFVDKIGNKQPKSDIIFMGTAFEETEMWNGAGKLGDELFFRDEVPRGEKIDAEIYNIDAEEEGIRELCKGSAAGTRIETRLHAKADRTVPKTHVTCEFDVTGLLQKHSGLGIGEMTGNSIKLKALILKFISTYVDPTMMLLPASFAGTAKNATPGSAVSVIAIHKDKLKDVEKWIAKFVEDAKRGGVPQANLRPEAEINAKVQPGEQESALNITLRRRSISDKFRALFRWGRWLGGNRLMHQAVDDQTRDRFIDGILALPDGVSPYGMQKEDPADDRALPSSNVGMLETVTSGRDVTFVTTTFARADASKEGKDRREKGVKKVRDIVAETRKRISAIGGIELIHNPADDVPAWQEADDAPAVVRMRRVIQKTRKKMNIIEEIAERNTSGGLELFYTTEAAERALGGSASGVATGIKIVDAHSVHEGAYWREMPGAYENMSGLLQDLSEID